MTGLGRRKSTRRRQKRDRDSSLISSRDLLISDLFKEDYYKRNRFKESLLLSEDNRRFKPKLMPLTLIDGRGVSYELRDRDEKHRSRRQTKAALAFVDPERVNVCIRRKRRREALFARNRAGRGKKVSERRIWKEDSYVKC